jgi:hypothetical protein
MSDTVEQHWTEEVEPLPDCTHVDDYPEAARLMSEEEISRWLTATPPIGG